MEYKTTLIVHTDGGSRGNPGDAAIGIVIEEKNGEKKVEHGEAIGFATNNVAEYSAVVKAYELIEAEFSRSKKVDFIYFFLDSLLVVSQLNGVYKIKDKNLLQLLLAVKEAQKKSSAVVSYKHVRREENKEADRLVNQALDKKDILH